MAKFKVGDRVRRVAHSSVISNCPIGHEAEVLELMGSYGFWYEGADGARQNTPAPDDWELAASASPVRERTIKEIVDGTYGKISVSGATRNRVGIKISRNSDLWTDFTATELTAAIETLTTIRDALDEVAA